MRKTLFVLSALLLAAAASSDALAWGRARVGVTPAGAIPPEPRAAPDQTWLWWCAQPQGYFPQVKECASAWKSVPAPVPPSAVN